MVTSWPASVHHLYVFVGLVSSRRCCPAMMYCLQSCWAKEVCRGRGRESRGGQQGERWHSAHASQCHPAHIAQGTAPQAHTRDPPRALTPGQPPGWRGQGADRGQEQPAGPWAAAHVHGPGEQGGMRCDGRYKHREGARCGEDLSAALLWSSRRGKSGKVWGAPWESLQNLVWPSPAPHSPAPSLPGELGQGRAAGSQARTGGHVHVPSMLMAT